MRNQLGSKLAAVRRLVGVALIALAVSTGCIAQDPPGKDFTEDLQQDFENEDYFNPSPRKLHGDDQRCIQAALCSRSATPKVTEYTEQ